MKTIGVWPLLIMTIIAMEVHSAYGKDANQRSVARQNQKVAANAKKTNGAKANKNKTKNQKKVITTKITSKNPNKSILQNKPTAANQTNTKRPTSATAKKAANSEFKIITRISTIKKVDDSLLSTKKTYLTTEEYKVPIILGNKMLKFQTPSVEIADPETTKETATTTKKPIVTVREVSPAINNPSVMETKPLPEPMNPLLRGAVPPLAVTTTPEPTTQTSTTATKPTELTVPLLRGTTPCLFDLPAEESNPLPEAMNPLLRGAAPPSAVDSVSDTTKQTSTVSTTRKPILPAVSLLRGAPPVITDPLAEPMNPLLRGALPPLAVDSVPDTTKQTSTITTTRKPILPVVSLLRGAPPAIADPLAEPINPLLRGALPPLAVDTVPDTTKQTTVSTQKPVIPAFLLMRGAAPVIDPPAEPMNPLLRGVAQPLAVESGPETSKQTTVSTQKPIMPVAMLLRGVPAPPAVNSVLETTKSTPGPSTASLDVSKPPYFTGFPAPPAQNLPMKPVITLQKASLPLWAMPGPVASTTKPPLSNDSQALMIFDTNIANTTFQSQSTTRMAINIQPLMLLRGAAPLLPISNSSADSTTTHESTTSRASVASTNVTNSQ
ncbi:mucin-2-like [Neocloeon triangulifer]|uniref:mucin-2-like n=1 Tax=Neocloeon triangulifer TaxID=2078957 RepID=UPI00286F57BC|nr:mucin-2-like [Neocloeon triangulifer]